MTVDVYRPPEANLQTGSSADQFYVVSRRKLIILFLSTVSLYTLYWFWRNWRNVRDQLGEAVWPIPRALFYIFFSHSLFRKVDEVLQQKQIEHSWSPSSTATALVVLTLLSNVTDRLAARGFGSPQTDIAALLLVPVLLPLLLKAQAAINASQDDPDGHRNHRLTLANYVWVVIGLAAWLVIGFGIVAMLGWIPIVDFVE